MDLKRALARGIQQQLVNGAIPLDRSEPIDELEGDGLTVEASAVTSLETQIRARTRMGTRYFTVRVTEHY